MTNDSINAAAVTGAFKNGVLHAGKLNRNIFALAEPLLTDDVIITQRQIDHINQRHPGSFERILPRLKQMLADPDYVLSSMSHDHTAILLKAVDEDGQISRYYAVLRIKTESDDPGFVNSIITLWSITRPRWERYLRNSNVIYNRE